MTPMHRNPSDMLATFPLGPKKVFHSKPHGGALGILTA